MPATPAIVIYYIYLCIELLPANAHSHIEELVFEMCFLAVFQGSYKRATYRAGLFYNVTTNSFIHYL